MIATHTCGSCFHRVGSKSRRGTPCLRIPGDLLVTWERPACDKFMSIDAGQKLYAGRVAQSTKRPMSETNDFIFHGEEE